MPKRARKKDAPPGMIAEDAPVMRRGKCPRWPEDRIYKDYCERCEWKCHRKEADNELLSKVR